MGPQTPKSRDAVHNRLDIFKFIKKLHICTFSPVQFTLRFVNLFVEVSRVCGGVMASNNPNPTTKSGGLVGQRDVSYMDPYLWPIRN